MIFFIVEYTHSKITFCLFPKIEYKQILCGIVEEAILSGNLKKKKLLFFIYWNNSLSKEKQLQNILSNKKNSN